MPPFSLFKKADYFYSTLAHELWNVASVLFANGSRFLRRLTPQGEATAMPVSPGRHVQAALTAIRDAECRSWPATGLSLGRSA